MKKEVLVHRRENNIKLIWMKLLKLLFSVQFQIILILIPNRLRVILEFLKQVCTAFLNVINFTLAMYHYSRNCMGTVFKIMYDFVIGHSNDFRLITPFSKMFFLLIKLHSQITGKWIPGMPTVGPQRSCYGFDKLSINASGV